MSKKEILIKLLWKISEDWPEIGWLIDILNSDFSSDELVDSIASILEIAMENTKAILSKEKMEKVMNILSSLKSEEKESNLQNEKDLVDLENLIDDL